MLLKILGMFKKIPGNNTNISGNPQEDYGKCSRRLRGKLLKILGNVPKISGNLNFDLFSEILLVFHEILQLTWYKTIGKKKIAEQFL